MGSPLVTVGTQIQCNHSGSAVTSRPSLRVKVSGQPAVLRSPPLLVAACPAKLPNGTPAPCVLVNFSVATLRLKIEGTPVLTDSSTGICIGPLGVTPTIQPGQQRVKGT